MSSEIITANRNRALDALRSSVEADVARLPRDMREALRREAEYEARRFGTPSERVVGSVEPLIAARGAIRRLEGVEVLKAAKPYSYLQLLFHLT